MVVSDNGPQYASKDFIKLAESYGFKQQTSSPYHPQRNGKAEHVVRTIKSLLKDSSDPQLALLSYRNAL